MYHGYEFKNLKIDRRDLLAITSHFADLPGACLLYSGSDYDSAKDSFLCLFPTEKFEVEEAGLEKNPWDLLIDQLPEFDGELDIPEWVGFFSYEMGAYSDREFVIQHHQPSLPLCYFQRCGLILRVNHHTNTVKVYLNPQHVEGKWKEEFVWQQFFVPKQSPGHFGTIVQPLDSPETYSEKIESVKNMILAGEVYQVNISQKTLIQTSGHPFSVFSKLVEENPAPFCAFFNLGSYTLISSSPERLLCKHSRTLETRPIKGTIQRGVNAKSDALNRKKLLESQKDRAELLMITDLMRNDLGKVSESGSVQVKELYRCEAYQNVFHLLSIIQSVAKENIHPVDLLRECFPGGSITGCPKLRAMQVISQIEGRARDIYTGSIGYFTGRGGFDFNIAIRTILMRDGIVDIQLGGAIVADSDPLQEHEETLHKGASMFRTLEIY